MLAIIVWSKGSFGLFGFAPSIVMLTQDEGNVLPSYQLSWSSPVDLQFCKVNQAFWLVDKVEQLIRLDLEF